MSRPAQLCPAAIRLLEESAEWRLLGLLFEYPGGAWRTNVESLAASLRRPELRGMAEAALQHASGGLHLALFGPAGLVPVREVTHRGGVQFGYLMAELSAYYQAFGYEPAIEEAADHLAAQLGFVAFLKFKQACAVMEGDSAKASLAEEAAREFIREHIATQAEPVARSLSESGPGHLAAAARLILEHAGPPRRPAYPQGAGLNEDADTEPMCCGTPASGGPLVQLGP